MPVVIIGLILSFLVMMLFGGTELDRTLLTLARPRDVPGLGEVAAWIGSAAAPIPLLLVPLAATAWLATRSRWLDALLLLGIAASGHLLVDAVQVLSRGLRPPPDPDLFTTARTFYPSGPAANATITACTLAFVLTRAFPARAWALTAATCFALAVGTAKLIVGGNWPSEVIGGWALGLAWTLLLLMLARTDLGDGAVRPLPHAPVKAAPPSLT